MVTISRKDLAMLRRRTNTSPVEHTAVLPARKRCINGERFQAWLKEMEQGNGVFVAIHTSTPGNSRRHWSAEGRDAKKQRTAACMALLTIRHRLPLFPVHVKFTRYGPSAVDRHNLPGMLKHLIDGVADFYGVDDGDPRWEFEFAPPAKAPYWGVRIDIESISCHSSAAP